VLSPHSSKVAAYCKAERNPERGRHIDFSSFVVFPERQNSDGRQQGTKGRALGFALTHMEKKDQSGNNQNTAPGAYNTGDQTDD